MLDISFFLLGLNVNHRLGNGGGPAWLPEGAVAGVDYTEGEAWLFDTLITDLTTIHGDGLSGNFDPTAITAAGMAATEANTNRPEATNELKNVFAAMDFCIAIDWDQLAYGADSGTLIYGDDGDGDSLYTEIKRASHASPGKVSWTDGNLGQFNDIGTATELASNKIAATANAAGWLVSLNGAPAVLDSPTSLPLDTPSVRVCIGCNFSETNPLNGTIRRIIFYPNEQNAAFIEALAAVPYPVNAVKPVITGTPTVGEQLAVSNGTWLNTPLSYTRQWRRDGADIGGATAATYTLQAADEATLISCRVVATNADGSSGSTATAVGPIDPAP